VSRSDTAISNYDILSDADRFYLLDKLNTTKSTYPEGKTIKDLFLMQVDKTPSSIALKYEDKEISYHTLNVLSNQLAHYLVSEYKIGPGKLVGIELERSEWMVISLLAIIKSGGAYVPIDPEYPEHRKLFIKQDANLGIIINAQELSKFNDLSRSVNYSESPLQLQISPEDLAYVIYTSGSTGLPKGCMVTNASVVNYVDWIKIYDKGADYGVVDIFSSLSFDFTVTSLFGGLTQGKTLHIHNPKDDLSNVLRKIVENPLSAWIKLTPAHVKLIEESTLESSTSKVFIIGGEALTSDQIIHLQKNRGCLIYNEYGPTEATVGCIVKEITASHEPFIGSPIQNTEVLLLDTEQCLVPFGSVGEICISGVCLAKGYLNRPELTKEKFIAHPYKPGNRVYRTGDLGRWRADGNMEYLGRKDDQVKIRGYRIELGEIEYVLSGFTGTGQVVVLARELKAGGEKELVAYYTGDASAEDLRGYLLNKIPQYMVPGYYVRIEQIPLTSHGKVDRRMLPDPDGTGFEKAIYVAPKTEIERQLVDIWAQVLKINSNEIGLTSDFFSLGGNSINAIKLIITICRCFGIKLMTSDFLLNNKLESLARLIDSLKNKEQGNFELEL